MESLMLAWTVAGIAIVFVFIPLFGSYFTGGDNYIEDLLVGAGITTLSVLVVGFCTSIVLAFDFLIQYYF